MDTDSLYLFNMEQYVNSLNEKFLSNTRGPKREARVRHHRNGIRYLSLDILIHCGSHRGTPLFAVEKEFPFINLSHRDFWSTNPVINKIEKEEINYKWWVWIRTQYRLGSAAQTLVPVEFLPFIKNSPLTNRLTVTKSSVTILPDHLIYPFPFFLVIPKKIAIPLLTEDTSFLTLLKR